MVCILSLFAYVVVWGLTARWDSRGAEASGSERLDLRERLGAAIATFCIIGVGYLPAIPWIARLAAAESLGEASGGLPIAYGTLARMFGDYIGFGRGWRFALFGTLAIVGAIASSRRHLRVALMPIVIIAVTLIVFALRGGNRIMWTDRYLIFMAPAYLALIGVGAAELGRRMIGLVSRSSARLRPWTTEHAPAIACLLGLILVVSGAASRLPVVYGTNNKHVPDFDKAYGQIVRHVGADDLLLEASTPSGGSERWFRYYDSYYLRPAVWSGSERTLRRDELAPRIGEFVKRKGRLWVLLTLRPDEEHAVRAAAAGKFASDCYHKICVLRASEAAGSTMHQQLTSFTDAFASLAFPDPDAVRLTRRALEQVAEPSRRGATPAP